jgi:hypothetical protein
MTSSQRPAGPAARILPSGRLKAPIVTLLGWMPDGLLRLAEVLPTGLTYLGLTEDLASQCTYEWHERFVLEELAAFLSVWRSVTPDLQVVEVWLDQIYDRWKDAEVAQLRMMCKEAGVSCIIYEYLECSCSPSPMTFQWVRQGPVQSRESQLPRPQPILEP